MRRTEIIPFEQTENAVIYIKRDDLIPFSFGGSKVRIAEEVFHEMDRRGLDTIVSYGSASSNLNRVAAHMANVKGKHCVIIIKKDPILHTHPSFNEIMVLESGAEVIYTEPDEVAKTVQNTLARLTYRGLKPYYIYGDETGTGGETVLARAYRNVFREILQQEEKMKLHFDHIVVPVGTGSTLAGLVSACDAEHDILGISIARSRQKAEENLNNTLLQLEKEESGESAGTEEKMDPKKQMERCRISDDYLEGGYGNYGKELAAYIKEILKKTGMPLDPVYSGKAYFGMTREIQEGRLSGNCLFIHTGGLPLFYDFMEKG